ncbi:MAG TPA: hypothetical protein VF158_16870 [Longimicrobiales bacterium]
MRRFPPGARVVAAGAIVLAAACADVPETTSPERGADAARIGVPISGPDLAVLAREVPAFGGLFLDADGVPTVYLTDPGERGAVEAALGDFMASRGLSPSALRVREGRYGYARLDGWFRGASPEVLATAGVVFVDLDEASNRLLVGVEHAGAANAVRGALARLRIPADAVEIREVPPIHFAATLRDRVRPIEGGLQIHFGNFLCTLGFNAVRSGQNSFITNSHCTNTQGGTEGTQYFQPLSSVDGTVIATEVADPTYFRGGQCPRGRRCRFSDSSRAAYSSGVDFTLGAIAQTTSRGSLSGSLTIAGTFSITGERNPLAGEEANKVGRTTGWTFGPITNTCVNVNVSGTNITQLCQSIVEGGVGPGDSGSPVFGWTGGSSITLFGILWGGSSGGDLFVFSPITNIEQELGSLTTS